MVSDGHTRSSCDLNMDLQMTEFLIPNCFRLNVSDGGSTDERSNCIRMYIVLDCEHCNIICHHLYLCELLFACSRFPFSLGLTLHTRQNGFRRIIFMPLCHWVVVSVTQPLNKHPSEYKRQWHRITGVQKTQRLRWNSSDPQCINAAPTTSDEATWHAEKPGEEDCYTAGAKKSPIL